MEVKKGYKQTEVGVIPEDWEVNTLRSLLRRPPKYGINAPAVAWNDVFPRYVRITDINDRGKYSNEKPVAVNHPQSPEYVLEDGDVVVARTGASVGKSYLYDSKDGVLVFAGFLIRLSPNSKLLVPKYLAEYMHTHRYWCWVAQTSMRSGQPGVNGQEFGSLVISHPPSTKEQCAIVEALTDIDALISKLDELISKKKDIKQGAMQDLLTGKRRLPGFKGDWRPLSLARHSSLKARIGWQGLTTAEYLESGSINLVTGTDFCNGRINWANCHYVDEWRYLQDPHIQVAVGDILLTKDGTIGKVAFVDSLPRASTLNSGVFVIRPIKGSYEPVFLFYILTSSLFDNYLQQLQAGSTINHLYQKDFVNFIFRAPEKKEQLAIVQILSELEEEIRSLDQERIKTQYVRQGMMQELLAGRIRLA